MSWLRREVTGPRKICVISNQHLRIKAIFQYPQYGWSEQNRDVVHRYYMQHISENLYKACPDQHLIELFKWTDAKKNLVSLKKICYQSDNIIQNVINFY
jgi:hypothetical protein